MENPEEREGPGTQEERPAIPEPPPPARRPWHAPQFYVADVGLTENSKGHGADGVNNKS